MTSGLALTRMTPAHIVDGLRLCRASGWNQITEDWRFFLESPGSGAVLMERAGHVLGTAAFLRYDTLAWIAMMLVDPAERGVGLGAQLLTEALSPLAACSCVGLDATSAGERLYRRFGFVPDRGLVRMGAMLDGAYSLDPCAEVRPMLSSDLAAVCARDRQIFGADRSRLLAALFARAPECAWISPGADGVKGYTFGRPGFLYRQLGPLVAADFVTATGLLTACLMELHGHRVAIDSPDSQREWFDFLLAHGFAEERRFTRMFLHAHPHPGNPAPQFAICGPEFA